MITRVELEARVRRGIKFLNEKHPGWHRRVDTNILDIADGGFCVLGQSLGTYDYFLEDARDNNMGEIAFNEYLGFSDFNLDLNLDDMQDKPETTMLNEIWKEEITELQNAG